MVKSNSGRWTSHEHNIFMRAIKTKKSWNEVAADVGTRNASQCRSHNQKMKMNMCEKRVSSRMMVDRETQYEPQLHLFSIQPVRLTDCDEQSEDTTGSEEFLVKYCDSFVSLEDFQY